MRNVWFKWRTRETCESIVATVSFAEGIVRANGAGDRVVEIRLQELRSSSLTRGREWLQVALEEISALELRKMASARNVGRGPDKKWLAVGELRARLLEVLAPPTQVGCGRKRI